MQARTAIKILAGTVLCIYLAVLTKKVVFKHGGLRYYRHYFANDYQHYSVHEGWKNANTVPFRTIKMYRKGMDRNNANAEYNLVGNFIGFIPWGFLLPLLLPWFRHGIKMLLAGFLLSLSFETFQLLTGLGVWDVDDLLLNTAGSVTGYILFFIAARIKYFASKNAMQKTTAS